MKVTRLGYPNPILNAGLGPNAGGRVPSGGSALQVLTSDGSNGRYWGENVRRITSNGSNILQSPDVNFAAGSNVIFSIASNTLSIHSIGGSGSLSNATPLVESGAGSAGTGVLSSRDDHVHPADGGGGGGSDPFDGKPFVWTPPSSAHATDDEFNDGSGMSGPVNSLDAKWTKRNMGTSTWLVLDDAVAPGCAYFDIPTGQAASQGIYQTVPAGDWTYAAGMQMHRASDRQMWGIACVSSAGTGAVAIMDTGSDNANGIRAATTWGDGGAGTFSGRTWQQDIFASGGPGVPVTITLRKASGVYHMGLSWGHRLLPGNYFEVSYTPTGFTPAFIAFVRLYGTGVSKLSLDFFRKVA